MIPSLSESGLEGRHDGQGFTAAKRFERRRAPRAGPPGEKGAGRGADAGDRPCAGRRGARASGTVGWLGPPSVWRHGDPIQCRGGLLRPSVPRRPPWLILDERATLKEVILARWNGTAAWNGRCR